MTAGLRERERERDIFGRVVSPEVREKLLNAARLETLTKDYPEHPILINGPTAEALKTRDDLVLKSLGPLQVKGRAEPVDVYAVVEWRKPQSLLSR
jgi:class 3 adenylate cyclase